jgi:flagellar basal body rod protein FlgG
MANGLYVASSGSRAQLDRLETVSNNLANLMTSGFKRQEATYTEVHNDVSSIGSPDQAMGVRTPNRFLPEDRIRVELSDRYTSWEQGSLDQTDNPLDLALEGNGLFKVRDEAGNVFYSRHGRFQLSKDGTITNQSGLEVLGINNAPIKVPATQGLLDIAYDGKVSVGETQLGQIDVVTIGDGTGASLNRSLTHIGEGLYRLDDDTAVENKANGLVRQGFMEGSNVNAVTEMMTLLSASRLFDLNQQAAKAMGEMDSQAAKDVALVQG